MELRFKTNSLKVAQRVALALIAVRAKSNSPLMPNDVRSWADQRFPNLSEGDRSKLVEECELACAGAIDA